MLKMREASRLEGRLPADGLSGKFAGPGCRGLVARMWHCAARGALRVPRAGGGGDGERELRATPAEALGGSAAAAVLLIGVIDQ